MQYEFDTPMTSQKSIPGAVSKATCLTREDAMTASRCMCLSWCLRSTCDDFFQAKETSIKGRLIKVRLESLGTAIFQRSTYIHWQLTIEACHLPTAAVSKKNPLWTSIHQYMKYSTTWPQLFLFTTIQNQTVPHASIPWNQSAKSWPEAVNLHLNIVMPGISCFIHGSGVELLQPKVRPQPTEGLDLLLGLRGHGFRQFLPPRLSGTSLALYKLVPGPKHQPP